MEPARWTLTPKSCLSWHFSVQQNSQPIAQIQMSGWREKGVLTFQGESFTITREGLASGDFILASSSAELARAAKPSAFSRTILLSHAGREYRLAPPHAFLRTFWLFQGDQQIGSIQPKAWYNRSADVELPASLPPPVQLFVLWLVLILWRRSSE